jgi:hypothetical protein
VHTQAETAEQRDRADALELEKDVLKRQIADLRDKMNKTQNELDDLKREMENMVPRCVVVLVKIRIDPNILMCMLFFEAFLCDNMHAEGIF